MKNLNITAPGKLAALCLVILGCTAYLVASMFADPRPDGTPAWAIMTLVAGYLVGNGTGAVKGQPSVGVFSPPQDQAPMPDGRSGYPPSYGGGA